MWTQTSTVIVLLFGCCLAQDYSAQEYGTDDQAARAQHLAPNYVHHDPHLYDHAKAEPYNFGFESTDEFGTVMNRQEASDNSGAVRGSYGYTDPNGVYRHVDYIADEFGFRAQVKSNEPGMGSQSPANVEIYAEAPPAGVVIDRPYHHHHPSNPVPAQPRHQHGRHPGSVAAATSVNPSRQVRPAQAASPTIRNPTVASSSASSSAAGNRGAGVGPFSFVPTRHNPYPSAAAVTNQDYPQPVSRYGGPNPYTPRSNYGQGVVQQSSSAITSSSSATSQASATGAQTGYRYPAGNPHISNFVKSDEEKVEGGSIVLPTVVTSGNPTTLVKHIHTYPVAV